MSIHTHSPTGERGRIPVFTLAHQWSPPHIRIADHVRHKALIGNARDSLIQIS